jgi:hypothetical protein
MGCNSGGGAVWEDLFLVIVNPWFDFISTTPFF